MPESRAQEFRLLKICKRSVEAIVVRKRDLASANTKINPLDYVGLGY